MIWLKYVYYRLYKLAIVAEQQWNVKVQIPQIIAFFTLSIIESINF